MLKQQRTKISLFLMNGYVYKRLVTIDVVDSKMPSYYGPIPEPDSNQQHSGRYHWVKSAMEKLRSGCQIMEGKERTAQEFHLLIKRSG